MDPVPPPALLPPIVIRSGRLLDPGSALDRVGDLLVEGGRIAALGEIPEETLRGRADAPVEIDASGLVVAPGLVDLHVHLREPGFEESETVASGTDAAAAGGFTAVCCMANTNPVNDRPAITRALLEGAARCGRARVHPISSITRGLAGETLVDFEAQLAAGAVGFSDDGRPVADEGVMEAALARAAELGTAILSHCEVPELAAGGCMHEGEVSRALGVRGIPREAESRMVERDVRLSLRTGGRLHVCHVSVRESVRAIRRAKGEGAPVTAEVTPHHLTLIDEALRGKDPVFKMNPPLRTRDDVEAVREGLLDGTLDAIASDHAPHAPGPHGRGLARAPFGIIGLESTIPVLLTDLVAPGILDLGRMIDALTRAPARALGLAEPRLEVGAPADLTLLDLAVEHRLEAAMFRSRSRNCPWDGKDVRGRAAWTLVAGRVTGGSRAQGGDAPPACVDYPHHRRDSR